jgi:hypothetical protein
MPIRRVTVDTGQLHADIGEQLNRIRSGAEAFAPSDYTRMLRGALAERQWRQDFPALARLYDLTIPITITNEETP